MAASPELRRPESPAEFKLGPFLPLAPAEDRVRARAAADVGKGGGGGGGDCRTPTCKRSKIPAITSCPPAPKKTRRMESSCKRRLSELELFRVGPELMELLFRPLEGRGAAAGFLPANSPASRKRKGCCSQDFE